MGCAPVAAAAEPALMGCSSTFLGTLLWDATCFRKLPYKQAGFRSYFLSKNLSSRMGSIAKDSPLLFPPQLVDMIEDGWETSTHQRGS